MYCVCSGILKNNSGWIFFLHFISGDKFSRYGTLEGGFVNTNRSRLLFQKTIWEQQEKLEGQEAELTKVRGELMQIDGEVTKVLSEIQKIETTQVQLR